MRKFICKTFLFGGIWTIIIIFILVSMALYPDNYGKESHEINVRYSADRLNRIDSNKIVIIGGSGCGFGINSQLIHDSFLIPVINTGTHASIGIVMQLKLYEEFFQKGDIILIIPEYQQFLGKYPWGIEDETLYRILYNNYPKALKKMTIYQMVNTIKFIPRYFNNAYRRGPMDTKSPYHKLSLNKFGDVTHWEYRKHKEKIPSHTINEDCPNIEIIDFVCNFMHQQESKGIKCILLPPTYMQESYENSDLFINSLSGALQEHGIPFAAVTERYKFPDTLFYDTDYHLTYEGVEIRTKMLIDDIQNCLK